MDIAFYATTTTSRSHHVPAHQDPVVSRRDSCCDDVALYPTHSCAPHERAVDSAGRQPIARIPRRPRGRHLAICAQHVARSSSSGGHAPAQKKSDAGRLSRSSRGITALNANGDLQHFVLDRTAARSGYRSSTRGIVLRGPEREVKKVPFWGQGVFTRSRASRVPTTSSSRQTPSAMSSPQSRQLADQGFAARPRATFRVQAICSSAPPQAGAPI